MPTTLEAPPKPLGVFKLLSSEHIAVRDGWERPRQADGRPMFNDPETGQVIVPPKHKYRAGEPGNNIVRDRRDLVQIFGPEKFQRISGDPGVADHVSAANEELVNDNEKLRSENTAVKDRIAELERQLGLQSQTTTEPGVAGMTRDQMLAYARDNEIDVGDARTKADILAAIQLHQSANAR